jgi:hypothetical protein
MSTNTKFRKNQEGLLPSEAIIASIYETYPKIVHKAPVVLPQTAQTPYFRVTGRVLVTHIIGEVTTELDATGTNLDLWSSPSVGADVALCAVVAVASDTVGTLYTVTGTLANAMIATVSGAVSQQAAAILIADGTIDLKTSANNVGATKWTVRYKPIDAGATIVAI